MKKRLSIICMLLLALCSMVCVSCGDDDDDGNSKAESELLGTWKKGSMEGYWTYTTSITFNDDGTFEEIYVAEERKPQAFTTGTATGTKGTYRIDGNTMHVTVTERMSFADYNDYEWHPTAPESSSGTFKIKVDQLFLYADGKLLDVYSRDKIYLYNV